MKLHKLVNTIFGNVIFFEFSYSVKLSTAAQHILLIRILSYKGKKAGGNL